MIDLHVHSRHSDGVHTPAELVRLAHLQGVTLIGLADHDAVTGIDEAIAAGAQWGVSIIPAVELSVAHGRYADVHLLGYGIDHHDPLLKERLATFRDRRDHRNEAIIARINRKLCRQRRPPITPAEAASLADGAVGRPHIARVLMEHGHARNMEEAFSQYLIPCNVPKEYFPLPEAISEIHRLGGVAVLAHPTTITRDLATLERVVCAMIPLGLDGLETWNSVASPVEASALGAMARRFGLIETGGSDYHGIDPGERMGVIRGEEPIPEELGESLGSALTSRRHPRH